MAIKRLSNGLSPRRYEPSPFKEGALSFARSALSDPAQAFTLLILTTDLPFLSIEEQKECAAFILTLPPLLPGAEPERLASRFESALLHAVSLAKTRMSSSLHAYQERALPADGQALPHVFVGIGYGIDPHLFFAPTDPRKAKRALRLGKPVPEQNPFGEGDEKEWDISIEALAQAFSDKGFGVIHAPWIPRDYAGEFNQLGFRERARAFVADRDMKAELLESLPRPAAKRGRPL